MHIAIASKNPLSSAESQSQNLSSLCPDRAQELRSLTSPDSCTPVEIFQGLRGATLRFRSAIGEDCSWVRTFTHANSIWSLTLVRDIEGPFCCHTIFGEALLWERRGDFAAPSLATCSLGLRSGCLGGASPRSLVSNYRSTSAASAGTKSVKPNLTSPLRVSWLCLSLSCLTSRWAVIIEPLLSHVDRVWQPKRVLMLFTVSQTRGKLPSIAKTRQPALCWRVSTPMPCQRPASLLARPCRASLSVLGPFRRWGCPGEDDRSSLAIPCCTAPAEWYPGASHGRCKRLSRNLGSAPPNITSVRP
ncbi:hypothetical protein B0T16DRAFT_144916 [Cercophora newfieldiana]|uniref:Uncharacterized protein n=1 Tax=Cercophora newfieldiana TaxID=92897 RepID=A0AA40CP07_9PEZI|nr:hypothetical protein B0T16DRAFT_144916 [Cercophora newfieldiana]